MPYGCFKTIDLHSEGPLGFSVPDGAARSTRP